MTATRARPWNPSPDHVRDSFAATTDPRPEPGLRATLATAPIARGVLGWLVVIGLAVFALCLWRF